MSSKTPLVIVALLLITLISLAGFSQKAYSEEQTVMVDPGATKWLAIDLSKGAKFNGYFSVQGGSNDDVDFWVEDPFGNQIISPRRVQVDNNFQFTASQDGVHRIYFDNSMSVFSNKVVQLSYNIENPIVGGGCLIATAAFGSELAPQVQRLREARDNVLLKTQSGITFMTAFNQFYYSFSPTVAEWERQNPAFREAVKITITPLITTLSILNYLDIDSEAEMLGYGISVILLNLGMYFVAPVLVIVRLKNHYKGKWVNDISPK